MQGLNFKSSSEGVVGVVDIDSLIERLNELKQNNFTKVEFNVYIDSNYGDIESIELDIEPVK